MYLQEDLAAIQWASPGSLSEVQSQALCRPDDLDYAPSPDPPVVICTGKTEKLHFREGDPLDPNLERSFALKSE